MSCVSSLTQINIYFSKLKEKKIEYILQVIQNTDSGKILTLFLMPIRHMF